MHDYYPRTLCALAAAAVVHIGRLSPVDARGVVRDDPERAVEISLLCSAIAAAIPRERWPAIWSRPLQAEPFAGRSLHEVAQLDDPAVLRACVRRAAVVLAGDRQSGEPVFWL